MRILLAGGAGYIGSHTAVELLNAGYDVIIADNYCNSSPEAVRRIEEVTGKKVPAYKVDVRIKKDLLEVFGKHSIDCVIHFAGLKAVGESVRKPIEYYRNNIDTTLTLLECMKACGVHKSCSLPRPPCMARRTRIRTSRPCRAAPAPTPTAGPRP